jgi:hypothetical protein
MYMSPLLKQLYSTYMSANIRLEEINLKKPATCICWLPQTALQVSKYTSRRNNILKSPTHVYVAFAQTTLYVSKHTPRRKKIRRTNT